MSGRRLGSTTILTHFFLALALVSSAQAGAKFRSCMPLAWARTVLGCTVAWLSTWKAASMARPAAGGNTVTGPYSS